MRLLLALLSALLPLAAVRSQQADDPAAAPLWRPAIDWNQVRDEAARITKQYGADVIRRGALTPGKTSSEALWVLFSHIARENMKVLHLDAVGGSITAGGGSVGDDKWPEMVAYSLAKFFPQTDIQLQNSARGATGSLTTGFCLDALVGNESHILMTEFALNDRHMYGVDGVPYELLVRSALSRPRLPVLLNVIFWGAFFTPASAKDVQDRICKHYGIHCLSMQDIGLPMVGSGKWQKSDVRVSRGAAPSSPRR